MDIGRTAGSGFTTLTLGICNRRRRIPYKAARAYKMPPELPHRYARFSCNISQWRLSRILRLQPGNPVRVCLFHLPRFENVSPEICCHIFRTLSDAIGHELLPWHAATSLNERGRSKLRTVKMYIDMMLFWRRADSLFNQCEFMSLVTVHL